MRSPEGIGRKVGPRNLMDNWRIIWKFWRCSKREGRGGSLLRTCSRRKEYTHLSLFYYTLFNGNRWNFGRLSWRLHGKHAPGRAEFRFLIKHYSRIQIFFPCWGKSYKQFRVTRIVKNVTNFCSFESDFNQEPLASGVTSLFQTPTQRSWNL